VSTGRIQAYMFDESGEGIPQNLDLNLPDDLLNPALLSGSDSTHWALRNSESSISTLDTILHELRAPRHGPLSQQTSQRHPSLSIYSGESSHKPKIKYHFRLLPFLTLPVTFDRLALVTVLDRFHLLPCVDTALNSMAGCICVETRTGLMHWCQC
jgi:hypothetical protein